MKTYKLAEVHEAFATQGVTSRRHYATKCPICGTVQSMASLVRSGADPKKVDKSFGFSCEGRFSGAGAWPSDQKAQDERQAENSSVRGCNWTLGGLLQVHVAEVEYDDGSRHPIFDLATPEEAQALERLLTLAQAAE